MLHRDDLVRFLDESLAVDVAEIDDRSPLFSAGVIDSFALVELLAYLERRCGFRVKPTDVELENIDSIERILAYVERSVRAA